MKIFYTRFSPNRRQAKHLFDRLFPAKERPGVGDVKHGEVHAGIRRTFFGDFQLASEVFDRTGGKIFNHADTGLGFENDNEKGMFVHVSDVDTEIFTLLVNAVEIGFLDEAGNGLIGHERTGGEGGNGGEVEFTRVTIMGDEKTALVYDQRRRGISAGNESAERFVHLLDILFN
jgi:cold shock CspA family protein